jgi:hypothetical protein
MFITRRNHAIPVVTQDLEYKTLLAASDDVKSNDFIIDLYPFDRDPFQRLFVLRFPIYLPLVPSSRMKGAIIGITDRMSGTFPNWNGINQGRCFPLAR